MKTDSQLQQHVIAELKTVTLVGQATAVKFDIEAALKHCVTADAKTISVATKSGDMTLPGTVRSWAERGLATRSAWGSPGVRNVVDNMTLLY